MCVVPLGTVRSSPNCSKAFTMTTQDRALNPWAKLPISLRAIISVLVDRNRRRLHRAAHHRDGRGSAFPHRVRRVHDLVSYRIACHIEAPETRSVHILTQSD